MVRLSTSKFQTKADFGKSESASPFRNYENDRHMEAKLVKNLIIFLDIAKSFNYITNKLINSKAMVEKRIFQVNF